jgi:hypothetical protein
MKSISKFIAVADKKMMEGRFDDGSEPELDETYHRAAWLHSSSLAKAFSNAILGADPWRKKQQYTLPHHFENVMNWICYNLGTEFSETTIRISPFEATNKLMSWASDNPHFKSWQERINQNTIRLNCLHCLRDEALRMVIEKRRFIKEKKKHA